MKCSENCLLVWYRIYVTYLIEKIYLVCNMGVWSVNRLRSALKVFKSLEQCTILLERIQKSCWGWRKYKKSFYKSSVMKEKFEGG